MGPNSCKNAFVTPDDSSNTTPKPRQDIDAVVFDHDGTLVDSESITLGVIAEFAAEAGAEIYPEDIDRYVGADLHVVFAEIERRSGKPLPENTLTQFRIRQTARIEAGLKEIPGAHRLLSALSLPFAIASNAPHAKMELCLGATDLQRFFTKDRMISAYDLQAWKPDPAIFLRAAEVLGVEPAKCAAVEDSRPGLEAAIAAGMQVFALDPEDRFTDLVGVTRVATLDALHPYLT